MMNFGYGAMGGFGWIFMIVFWILVIWAIVALVRGNSGSGHGCGHDHTDAGHGNNTTPLDILKERYAKGEMDKKEFEQRKNDIAS